MSVLTVVRHGQARPFEGVPDALSERGQLQARALGEFWAREGTEFDEVISGKLARQRQTAALAWSAPAQLSDGWNEYDAENIVGSVATPARDREFQKMFEAKMLKWLNAVTSDAAEPFSHFRARILQGLRRIQDGPSNRRVLLFTSGGPIGLLVQTALGAPESTFLDVNWRVRNCSITEFLFTKDRLTLDSFNSVTHLPGPLRTYR